MKYLKNFILIVSVLMLLFFAINCGSTNKTSQTALNLKVKAPKMFGSGTYTAIANAYDVSGNLISTASTTITNFAGSITMEVPAQENVSIVVSVYSGDNLLIRGSKKTNIFANEPNEVEITLGQHSFNENISDTEVKYIDSVKSFGNYTLTLWSYYKYDSQSENVYKYLSIFDENKGIFTAHYNYAVDTPYSYRSDDITTDTAGNIFLFKNVSNYYDPSIILNVNIITQNTINTILDTTIIGSQLSALKIINDYSGKIYLITITSDTINIYNFSYSSSAATLTFIRSIEKFSNESNFYNVSIIIDKNNRLHIAYPLLNNKIAWRYSDNLGETFSDSQYFSGINLEENYSADKNFIAYDSQALIGRYHSYSNDSSIIYVHRLWADSNSASDSKIVLYNDTLPPTYFIKSYYCDLLAAPDGSLLFQTMLTETEVPYLLISNNFGQSWSNPIRLFENKIYSNAAIVNNNSLKYVLSDSPGLNGNNLYLIEYFKDMPVTYPSNRVPIILNPLSDTSVVIYQNFTYSYNVIDLDNNNLFFTKISGPQNLEINQISGKITWYEPSPADTYTIEIAVSDLIDTTYNRFTLRVIED